MRSPSSSAKAAKRGSSLLSSSQDDGVALGVLADEHDVHQPDDVLLATTFSISRAMLPSKWVPVNPMTRYSSGPSVTDVLLCMAFAGGPVHRPLSVTRLLNLSASHHITRTR